MDEAKNKPVGSADTHYTPAKTEDVVKTITKSNEKHKNMMERLS